MSVDKTPTGVVYTVTNGAVGQQYPLTFPYINGADVKAYYVQAGVQTSLLYGTHYAVVGQNFIASIVLPVGAKLAIYRQTDLTQEILWKDGQAVYTPDIMKADDKLTLIAQEISADMSRTVKLTREEEAAGGKPEDVVQSIYASRDAAAASADNASAQATAAQNSATAASEKADESAGHAAAAAQSAESAYSASEGSMALRMDAVEEKNTLQDNRLTTVEAVTVLATPNPGAGKIPVADGNGKLDAWISQQTQYAACATAAATAAKDATLTGFSLVKGARVFVTFANANTSAGALTLNVNSTGAKTIYNERGAVSSTNPAVFPAGVPIEFVYDGDYWRYITLPSVPAAISTCTTTGDWTITGCKIGVPLDIVVDVISADGSGNNQALLWTKSGATGGNSSGNDARFAIGRANGWFSTDFFRCYPTSASVVIGVERCNGVRLTAMQ